MGDDPREQVFGDWVIRLDGNVLEVLHRTGVFNRWHVDHVAVEGREKGLELRLNIGVEVSGVIIQGHRIDVPAEHRDAVMSLLAEARRRRDDR